MDMRDPQSILRSIQRRLKLKSHKSSWPYLSGDTYLSAAHINLDDFLYSDEKFLSCFSISEQRFFISTANLSKLNNRIQEVPSEFLEKATLLVHNGDKLIDNESFLAIAQRFRKTFAVNWLGDPRLITPIPIGLENHILYQNGVKKDFDKIRNSELPNLEARPNNFLVSFSLHTNPIQREKALNVSKTLVGASIIATPSDAKTYRNNILNSKFVISPPGNGPDCHRTWEALYLGAVPVVHKSFWPFNHLDLPVVQVDDWTQIEEATSRFNLSRFDYTWDSIFRRDFENGFQ